MNNINDFELKFHRKIAESIISDANNVKTKIEKSILKQYNKLEKQKQLIHDCDDLNLIANLSSVYEQIKKEFIEDLSVYLACENLCSKNNQRIEYIDKRFKNVGIYNFEVDKKQLKAKFAEINKISLDENQEVINSEFSSNYILLSGKLKLKINNGVFDLTDENNEQLFEKYPEDILNFIFKYNLKSVSKISANLLFNVKIKKLLIKKIAYYVFDKKDKMSIEDINRSLGDLLNFSISVTKSINEYIFEVENLFNVKVVKRLKELNPFNIEMIDNNLKCNLNSKFL